MLSFSAAIKVYLCTVEVSHISFRQLVEREIQEYINKHAVLNYAGAFESDAVLLFAEQISGSYNRAVCELDRFS